MPEPAKYDAIWVDPLAIQSPTHEVKMDKLSQIARKAMGIEKGTPFTFYPTLIEGGMYAHVASAPVSFYFPSNHPRARETRHEWKAVKNMEGVKVGTLKPDDAPDDFKIPDAFEFDTSARTDTPE